MSNFLLVFQVLRCEDWLKIYNGEFHSPLLCEEIGESWLHFCFANNGGHLYFSVDDAPLSLDLPRETQEKLNLVELASWGAMTFDDWYLEMRALIASGYKEE